MWWNISERKKVSHQSYIKAAALKVRYGYDHNSIEYSNSKTFELGSNTAWFLVVIYSMSGVPVVMLSRGSDPLENTQTFC